MLGELRKARLACQYDVNYRLVCVLNRADASLFGTKAEFLWSLQRKAEGRNTWHHVEGTCVATHNGTVPLMTRTSGAWKTHIWPEDRK